MNSDELLSTRRFVSLIVTNFPAIADKIIDFFENYPLMVPSTNSGRFGADCAFPFRILEATNLFLWKKDVIKKIRIPGITKIESQQFYQLMAPICRDCKRIIPRFFMHN
jgi:hypothetical protein